MTRMLRKQLPIAAVCVVLFSGCARMTVRVEILNPEFWASPEYVDSVTIARIVATQQAILDGKFFNLREAWKTDVRAGLREASEKEVSKGGVRPISSGVVDEVAADFGKLIDREFATSETKFNAAFSKISIAVKESSQSQRDGMLKEANNLYLEGVQVLAALGPRLSNETREIVKRIQEKHKEISAGWLGEITQFGQAMEQKGNEIAEGLIGEAGILDDPRAGAIVYAPCEYWGGQFNETLCSGSFGNSDCAIKMDGPANFTIKGVRLDATNITVATFTVGREMIQALAAVYGVPLPKSQAAAAGGATQPAAAADVESPARRERDASTAIQQLRLARMAMFETIVGQRAMIKNAAERPAAVSTIKGVVVVNRKLYDPQGCK